MQTKNQQNLVKSESKKHLFPGYLFMREIVGQNDKKENINAKTYFLFV